MRVTMPGEDSRRACRGFSLLEAVIAAGLVLLTVTAVSLTVASVLRAHARLDGTMDADRAVRGVAGRLRSLPFCARSLPGPADGEATEVVAAVFPHAAAWRNTPRACYVAAGDPNGAPGSFVTLWDEAGAEVRCTAWFLGEADGPRLPPAEVAGWDVGGGGLPPGPALEVVLACDGPGGERSVRLVLAALPPAAAPSSSGGGG